ncbi:MAG TPA: ATP-binding protein [Kofleriaceae bacterium]|nr:ATP-binding protein [Kofleriaceae bacterium]
MEPRDKIVVAHPERKAQRTLQRLVGATLCPVEVVADLDALVAALNPSAIAVVDAGLAQTRPDLRMHPARAWIAVPGEGLTPADAASSTALLAAGWDHVVSHPMPLLAEELIATVQKLLRKDVFGLEKYMAWGAEVRSYVLDDARDRDAAVAKLAADVVAVGLPDRIGSVVSVIADELLANAIYSAPVDGSGARFRANEPRDQARALTGRDAVTVRWATDARYLAIEVRDQWGSIDVPDVAKQLATGGNHVSTDGEGGMGLSLAYACSNQLVIDCEPRVKTEVIALLDVRYKPTELARTASFHAFTHPC